MSQIKFEKMNERIGATTEEWLAYNHESAPEIREIQKDLLTS